MTDETARLRDALLAKLMSDWDMDPFGEYARARRRLQADLDALIEQAKQDGAAEARAGLVSVEVLTAEALADAMMQESRETLAMFGLEIADSPEEVLPEARRILAILAATPPTPAVERCGYEYAWGTCGGERGFWRHDRITAEREPSLFHPFTPTPEKAP